LAKIAVELEEALTRRAMTGAAGGTTARRLAQGEGWTVADVICTSGPQDRPFEEQHANVSIAVVVAGTFQYRREHACELMTPGSLLLGSSGQSFECRHDHGTGDRCLSFSYTPDYFGKLTFAAGGRGRDTAFSALRLPPLRALSGLVARAMGGLSSTSEAAWEEISLELAVKAVQLVGGFSPEMNEILPSTFARVTRAVRAIEHDPSRQLSLAYMAREAGLTPYHFLRTFRALTGLTPHQYLRRTRLREAARRLVAESEKIVDIALSCGFGDVSNFNHAFRAEFGVNPRGFMKKASSSWPGLFVKRSRKPANLQSQHFCAAPTGLT
jgi:AraC family transcriptional regulator